MFRDNVGNATAAGQRAVLEHPLIADEFPYRLWSATHDERTRPTHRAMETHGQNGTAVYRSDDPMWDVLWPPCEWNCRCVCIPLSLEDAAREGSREAQKWLLTGTPPDAPEFAKVPYPIQPPEGWPSHRRGSSGRRWFERFTGPVEPAPSRRALSQETPAVGPPPGARIASPGQVHPPAPVERLDASSQSSSVSLRAS
jgi:SPP1 gp7 family putative phage head morphogenesis protein